MSLAKYDPEIARGVLASMPAYFSRSAALAAKTVATAADRYTLGLSTSWQRLGCNISDAGFYTANLSDMVLSNAPVWDSTATDYTVAANRAGKDFYIYSCNNGGDLALLLSANATYPAGYTATNSRKLGGFHCLCAAVRHDLTLTAWAATTAITTGVTRKATAWDGRLYRCYTAGTTGSTEPTWSGYAVGDLVTDGTCVWRVEQNVLEGYEAGDIIPTTVWDLKHRPVPSPEGMAYVSGIGRWMDIYMPSVSGGALVSVNGGTIADGGSTPAFHWYKFSQWLGQVGKRLPTQHEFVAASLGSNQGTNISGGADPVITGGHTDTAGRRMISNVGCEDCCGTMWHWLSEAGGFSAASTFVNAYDANDSGVAGQSSYASNRALGGGSWALGVVCGSRSLLWNSGPLVLVTSAGVRGVAESFAVPA